MPGADPFTAFFDGTDLAAKRHQAAYLVTTTADGWPHPAMISAGELLVTGDRAARLALWPGSRTTEHLRRTGRSVVLLVVGDLACRARLTLAEAGRSTTGLALFAGQVDEVAVDRAPYAVLRAGVQFDLTDPDGTLRRWAATLEELRGLLTG